MNESNTWVLLGLGQEEADKVGGRMEEERLMPHPKFTLCPSLSFAGYSGAVFWICQYVR